MTLKEVISNTLSPDAKSLQTSIDFLDNISKNLNPKQQQQLKAISDGMKQQQAVKAKEENEKPIPQPEGNIPTTAQVGQSKTNTAQVSQTNTTAQLASN